MAFTRRLRLWFSELISAQLCRRRVSKRRVISSICLSAICCKLSQIVANCSWEHRAFVFCFFLYWIWPGGNVLTHPVDLLPFAALCVFFLSRIIIGRLISWTDIDALKKATHWNSKKKKRKKTKKKSYLECSKFNLAATKCTQLQHDILRR